MYREGPDLTRALGDGDTVVTLQALGPSDGLRLEGDL